MSILSKLRAGAVLAATLGAGFALSDALAWMGSILAPHYMMGR